MKRAHLGKILNKTFLTVPAAALMLGASQAQTTIGLNFQSYYYSSGTIPQTIGFGAGYQTTGFPVTSTAFGISAANWWNTDPLSAGNGGVGVPLNQYATFSGSTNFAGTLTAFVNAPNSWTSGIGEENDGFNAHPALAETVVPGDDEVTWGYLDDGNVTGNSPSVTIAGLAAKFPKGYVIQTLAVNGGVKTFNNVDFTDGTTFTNTAIYSTYQVASPAGASADTPVGTIGVSTQSPVYTNDTIIIHGEPKTSGNRSTLAGVILTDEPVVTRSPLSVTNSLGTPLILGATAIGIPPLNYQWQLNGTNIIGATNSAYTNLSLTVNDAGNYAVVVTNLYGSAISSTSSVSLFLSPVFLQNLTGGTNLAYVGLPTLSVVAEGPSLDYQWLMNGSPISGATNSSVNTSNAAAGLSGYNVLVSNSYGTTNSWTNYINFIAAPDAYTAAIGKDGPVSYWPLNETAGTEVIDYSGSGHNAWQSNTITIGAAGPQPPAFKGFSPGKTAYTFDGSSGFIACGNEASLSGSGDFSVEAWINTTSTAGGVIVDQRDPTGFVGEYSCQMNASGSLEFFIYGGSYQFDIVSSRTVNDGNWHHVVFVRGGNSGNIYIDGANVASGSGPVQALSPTLQTYIGADIRDNNNYFAGSMADVAIYASALGSGQVINHYVAATGIPLTVGLITGGVIQDSKPVGAPNDGLNHGTIWFASSTDLNSVTRTGVQQFSETNDTQIAIPPSLNLYNTNETISFWVNYAFPLAGFPGSGNEAAMLFDCRTTNGTIIALDTAGTVEWQNLYPTNGINANYKITGANGVADGNWHNVAVTLDQSSNGVISIYVDGVLDTQANNPGAWYWQTNQEIELGRSHDSYWYIYNGQMDDFRIYNRILTSAEVAVIGTEATSDSLVDTNALQVRYDFSSDSAQYGHSLIWSYGLLQSSPTLGAGATWTTLTNAISPQPVIFNPTVPAAFYRSTFTP